VEVVVPRAAAERLTASIRETQNPEALVLDGLGPDHRLSTPALRCHMPGIAHHRG
jgi:hypothetical protein